MVVNRLIEEEESEDENQDEMFQPETQPLNQEDLEAAAKDEEQNNADEDPEE
jgi:hypothetical protein